MATKLTQGPFFRKILLQALGAVFIVLFFALFRHIFLQLLGTRVAFITFYPAVMLSALFLGLPGGLTSLVFSACLADLFWIQPVGSLKILDPADLLSLMIFILNCLMIVILTEVMRRAQRRAQKAEEENKLFQERSKSAESIKELNQRLQMATKAGNIGIWDLEFPQKKLLWDEQMYQLYDISAGDFHGTLEDWESRIAPDDLEAFRESLDLAQREEKEFNSEFQVILPTGAVRFLKISGVCQKSPDGFVSRLVGTNWDVTERRQWEEKLRQSEKMEAIGQLAGGIAHDFNNQLAGIMGFSQLLEQKSDNPETKRFAERITQSALKASTLTKQLLAFARKGKFLSAPLDFHNLIRETVHLLEHSISKKITINLKLDAPYGVVLGDSDQLQSALLNLAFNARDAMDESGELTFTTSVVMLHEIARKFDIAEGEYLQICVIDNGTGIGEETKKHLFEPFFTTKEKGKGTGLGLAAVYGAMKNHHGAVSVYSELNHGTTFRLYLPLCRGETPVEGKSFMPLLQKGSGHILVVDDVDSVRELAEEILLDLGYQVTTQTSAESALVLYGEEWKSFDLVILDLVMPQMTGHELYLCMKQINPKVKAIIYSGYGINGEVQAALDDGVLGFIQKPFQMAEMSLKVAEALGGTQPKPEVR